jgi:hypothetical protein
MERVVVYVDELEAGELLRLSLMERRTASGMARQLLREVMEARWAVSGRPPGTVPQLGVDVGEPRSDEAPPFASAPRHEFLPQKLNALRCKVCGGKAGEHR